MEQQSPPKPKRKSEPSPAARALRLLARRDYTRLEIARKLAPYCEDPLELQALLDDFTERGWLSETRAVDQLVHAKRARFGAARIRQSLIEKGVSGELMSRALDSLRDTEVEAARGVWSRKFRSPPDTPAARARQVRFLQARGFSIEIAMRVVRDAGADADDEAP